MKLQQKTTYINEKKVAEITGLSVATLQNQRFYKTGIAYSKVGRSVRYSLMKVHQFMQEHTIQVQNAPVIPSSEEKIVDQEVLYLKEKQVAKMIGLSVPTLQNYRFQSKGMNYVKIGRSVRYSSIVVQHFMEAHTVQLEE